MTVENGEVITVRDLIGQLSAIPHDLPVVVNDQDTGWLMRLKKVAQRSFADGDMAVILYEHYWEYGERDQVPS